MSDLHVERLGAGPPLVMVHGWAMNAATWGELAESFAQHYSVYVVELPGHARSPWNGDATLQGWAQQVRAVVPGDAVWVGWSLGVAVSLQVALMAPDEVRSLVLITGTPCFMQTGNWPNAMAPRVLAQFSELLGDDAAATVERFLALQVRGAKDAGSTLRRLKGAMRALPDSDPEALAVGLELLRTVDLRNQLKQFECPALWLLGERDTLVPAAMGWDLAEWMPHAKMEVLDGAGHAPFLSHLSLVIRRVDQFLGVSHER